MELLFESRLEITRLVGRIYPVQERPVIEPDPIFVGGSQMDSAGDSCFGAVLYDKGIYRMWYEVNTAGNKDGELEKLVAYAESNDGLNWKKPILKQVDFNGFQNNLINIPFLTLSVFIDPQASDEYRYRATGFVRKDCKMKNGQDVHRGYNTAHSSDGINWIVDPRPDWSQQDVITSIYHPHRKCGLVAMKHVPRFGGFIRRSIWTAELHEKYAEKGKCALIPDNFDDVCAISKGFVSGDYYGMGMLPAQKGTVGFLWQFRHSAPKMQGRDNGHNEYGVFGSVDVSLVYQPGKNERWLHPSGRVDFFSHRNAPEWASGCIYTASCPIEKEDEHWLYITGTKRTHGWYVDEKWNVNSELKKIMLKEGITNIGLARWPKYRLFGFRADPYGEIDINLGELTSPVKLKLNLKTEKNGYLKTALIMDGQTLKGYGEEEAIPLSGDYTNVTVSWKHGSLIHPSNGKDIKLRIFLDKASVFAYKLQEVID